MQRHRQIVANVLVAGTVLLGGAGLAMAEEMKPGEKVCPVCNTAGSDATSYASHAGSTLMRGVANTALGWTELIRQPVQTVQGGGNVLVGIGNGLGYSVKRTAAGVGELLTFWMPKTNDRYTHFANDCPICMGKH
mgnify:CR=1 FL=1